MISMYIIASVYSLITLGIALVVIIRTLVKIIPEANIRNGLIQLRRLLLVDGVSTFILISVAFIIIGARFVLDLESYRILSYALLMIFSTVILIKSFVKYMIYTLSYSTDSKTMHRKEGLRLDKATRIKLKKSNDSNDLADIKAEKEAEKEKELIKMKAS